MNQSIAASSPERIRIIARESIWLLSLTGLTVLAARVAIAVPGTPVPATLQVAAVIFAGCAGGARRGALSQLLYLLLGFAGAPVFAAGHADPTAIAALPTMGYLLAFVPAAYLAGHFTGPRGRWLGAAAALATIYLLGTAWLMLWAAAFAADASPAWVLMAGVWPFLLFDLLKAALAAWTAGPIRKKFGSEN